VFGLHKAVLSMVDRETGTVWTHLDGKAIEGPLKGARMTMVPMPQMTWGDWKAAHPNTKVLSPDTPFRRRYRPARIGVFNPREAIVGDDRLASNALVVGVEVGGQHKGYPLADLEEVGGVVNDELAALPLVVFYDYVGQTGLAYSRVVDGRPLDFYNASSRSFELWDRQTESLWDIGGLAVSGPLAGTALQFIPSFISEWYGWSAYHPETALFQASP
jgi:hypothetical protein